MIDKLSINILFINAKSEDNNNFNYYLKFTKFKNE